MEQNLSQIGYAYVVAEQFPNQRTISFQGNFAIGTTKEEISAEMDKLAAVLDRQAMRIQIPNLKHTIEVKRRTLRTHEDQIKAFQTMIAESAHDTSKRNNQVPQVELNLKQALVTYEGLKQQIADDEKSLADLEQKAA